MGCTCTTVLCVEDVLCTVWVPRVTLRSVIRLGSKLFYPPGHLASPEGDIFNNCLIRLENVSFCFRKNHFVRGDIYNDFVAINLDQMSVEPAAAQQLTPRNMCHSASSFRIPATNKQTPPAAGTQTILKDSTYFPKPFNPQFYPWYSLSISQLAVISNPDISA